MDFYTCLKFIAKNKMLKFYIGKFDWKLYFTIKLKCTTVSKFTGIIEMSVGKIMYLETIQLWKIHNNYRIKIILKNRLSFVWVNFE
jgi:hypothetical protein